MASFWLESNQKFDVRHLGTVSNSRNFCKIDTFSSISNPTFAERGSECAKVDAITLFSTMRFRVAGFRTTALADYDSRG